MPLLRFLQNQERGEQACSGHQLFLKQHQPKEEVLNSASCCSKPTLKCDVLQCSGGKTAHRTSPVQPNYAAGSQQEHRPLSRHAETGDRLSSTLSTDLLQAIFSLRATWLLSYDLNCSRPFACLCRGHSSVKVERPCKRQPQIAKTTLVCAALSILGCGDLGPFSLQTET